MNYLSVYLKNIKKVFIPNHIDCPSSLLAFSENLSHEKEHPQPPYLNSKKPHLPFLISNPWSMPIDQKAPPLLSVPLTCWRVKSLWGSTTHYLIIIIIIIQQIWSPIHPPSTTQSVPPFLLAMQITMPCFSYIMNYFFRIIKLINKLKQKHWNEG